jgi:hypothetical protein
MEPEFEPSPPMTLANIGEQGCITVGGDNNRLIG